MMPDENNESTQPESHDSVTTEFSGADFADPETVSGADFADPETVSGADFADPETDGVTDLTKVGYKLSGADADEATAGSGPAAFDPGPVQGLATRDPSMTKAEKAMVDHTVNTSFQPGNRQASNLPFKKD